MKKTLTEQFKEILNEPDTKKYSIDHVQSLVDAVRERDAYVIGEDDKNWLTNPRNSLRIEQRKRAEETL
jgi:hypothetical protein